MALRAELELSHRRRTYKLLWKTPMFSRFEFEIGPTDEERRVIRKTPLRKAVKGRGKMSQRPTDMAMQLNEELHRVGLS